MRILLATNGFLPEVGGVQIYCYKLANNLALLGEEIIVLAPGVEGGLEFDKKENFKIIRTRKKGSSRLAFLFLLKRERIEKILVGHGSHYIRLAFLANLLLKIPYYIVIHGTEILLPERQRSIQKTFSKATRIIAVSNFIKRLLIQIRISEKKIAVILNGVDPVKFNPGLDPSKIREKYNLAGKKVILTVSRLTRYKGQHRVLEALPQVLKKIPNLVYLIVGKGDEEKYLRKIVRNLGLEGKIIFIGEIFREETPLYYAACDVFILPSDLESFGIAYLEANACGKPVIGGRSGGVSDAIIDGETGLLVDPLNINQIVGALVKLLTNSELARKLGEEGRKRVERELNWQAMAKKIKGIIHEKG